MPVARWGSKMHNGRVLRIPVAGVLQCAVVDGDNGAAPLLRNLSFPGNRSLCRAVDSQTAYHTARSYRPDRSYHTSSDQITLNRPAPGSGAGLRGRRRSRPIHDGLAEDHVSDNGGPDAPDEHCLAVR